MHPADTAGVTASAADASCKTRATVCDAAHALYHPFVVKHVLTKESAHFTEALPKLLLSSVTTACSVPTAAH